MRRSLFSMDYGKPFGVGVAGGTTVFGISMGYGWLILAAVAVTVIGIVVIRYFFRRHKNLGSK